METQELWKHVVVLGAAGKMGRGISLLLLTEIARVKNAVLTLMDANVQAFDGLRKYLREHLRRHAERNINELRIQYSDRDDLIDNSDIIHTFVEEAMDRVRCVTSPEECRGARMVFEAIIEDIVLKARVLSEVDKHARAYYFTNTSSIPIHILQQKSGLVGRLIGFHFYNPPPVQKLVEVIVPEKIEPGLKDLAVEVGARLNKTLVFSNDVAGFIGNGHLIREIMEACCLVRELQKTLSPVEALCTVNKMTQEFLIRPMGIFQLLDYVGIDVCQLIAKIMTEYLPGNTFFDPLIQEMVRENIKAGQYADGSQKDGFFHYEHGRIEGVYDSMTKSYVPYDPAVKLGALPPGHLSWKVLSRDKDKKKKIEVYFNQLWEQQTLGSELARTFLENSLAIAKGLVKEGVAHSLADVDTILEQGFFHLYGVEAPFLSRSSRR